jgi:uncharacterized membrane protein
MGYKIKRFSDRFNAENMSDRDFKDYVVRKTRKDIRRSSKLSRIVGTSLGAELGGITGMMLNKPKLGALVGGLGGYALSRSNSDSDKLDKYLIKYDESSPEEKRRMRREFYDMSTVYKEIS